MSFQDFLRYTLASTSIVLVISYLLTVNCYAQNIHAVDSLSLAYKAAKHDTEKINHLLSLGEELFISDIDTILIFMQEVLQLAEKNLPKDLTNDYQDITILQKKYLSAHAEALNNIGYFHEQHGDLSQALEYYLKGLKIDEALGNKDGVAACLNNIGSIYQNYGDIEKALEYYHRSLELYKGQKNSEGLAHAFNNLGFIYDQRGDVVKGLEYYHKCLKILEELGNNRAVSTVLGNIAGIHMHQGDIENGLKYLQKSLEMNEENGDQSGVAKSLSNIAYLYYNHGDPHCSSSKEECTRISKDKAMEYLHKSLSLHEEIGNKNGIASVLSNIGSTYIDEGDTDKGLEYLNRSLILKEEIGDLSGLQATLNNISRAKLSLGQIKEARTYAERSLSIGQKIGNPNRIMHSAKALKNISVKEQDYEEALKMYELHIQMRDSIKNEETQKATIRQQTKYEFEREQLLKEQEEKEVSRLAAEATSRRDNLQYSVILIAILALFSSVLALGFINVSERMAEGIIFFSFLILFEFLLVLADPHIEGWSGSAPGIKLLFNAGIAALVFPLHSFFEERLKGRLVKI